MPRKKVEQEENIVRAIMNAHWDEQKGRYSSELFKGEATSVSRLSVKNLADTFVIFREDLDNPPRSVVAAGEINVGELSEIGRQFQTPTVLTVEEDPTESNPAHAEIPEKITRGLAFKIIERLKIHNSTVENIEVQQ